MAPPAASWTGAGRSSSPRPRGVERAFGLGPCALTEAMALLQDRLASAET